MKHNRITEIIGQALVICILTIAFIFALKQFASSSYVTYYEDNEGKYTPVEFSPCEVLSVTEREIVVDLDGNAYAAYGDWNGIRKGDVVWAGFASYEGNLELIDVQ